MVAEAIARARSPDALGKLEKRRLAAARLFKQGVRPAEVARRLGVSRQSGYEWYGRWKKEGRAGLLSKRRPGQPARLTVRQERQLCRALVRGPHKYGWKTQLWTLERIQGLIRRVFGIQYHVGHIWHLMRRLGFTAQRPEGQARERDKKAVKRWLRWKWPAIKKNSNDGGHGW